MAMRMKHNLQVSADQRTRLMTTTERLGNMSDRIKDSQRTMLETEDLGVSILEDLHSQRQSLLGAHDTVILFIMLETVNKSCFSQFPCLSFCSYSPSSLNIFSAFSISLALNTFSTAILTPVSIFFLFPQLQFCSLFFLLKFGKFKKYIFLHLNFRQHRNEYNRIM